MPQGLLLALQSSLAIGLVTVAGLYNLSKYARRNQRLVLLLALILCASISLITVNFFLPLIGGRQLFDGLTALIAAAGIFLLALTLFEKVKNDFFYWTSLVSIFAAGFFFALDIISYFNRLLAINAIITSAVISKIILGIVALLLPLILVLATDKLLQQRNDLAKYFRLIMGIGLAGLFIRSTTVALQMFLVLGQLPASPFLFNIVTTLINQANLLFYLVLACFVVLAIVPLVKKPNDLAEISNPAEARKAKAFKRHIKRWASVSLSASLVIIFFIFVSQTIANREVKLSEAKRVSAKDGKIVLGVKELMDKEMHRYYFSTTKGTKVRFLAIYKGAGVFGVALDACQLCGEAGYYQNKDDIICRKCDSIINKETVGFSGGCNPIPLSSTVKEGQVMIKVSDLEKNKGVFE